MSIPHLDPCLNPERYQTPLTKLTNCVNANGEYTLCAIDEFAEEFKRNIETQVTGNPLTDAVNIYGSKEFYEAVGVLNNDFLKREYILPLLPSYEILNTRIEGGRSITPVEFSFFIKEFFYTPTTIINAYNNSPTVVLDQLNSFYTGSFKETIMGGFCSLMNNIFSAIDGFFDILEKVQGLIADAIAFITKIRNIERDIKAFIEAGIVRGLLEQIKQQIVKAVEGIINKIESIINNFDITSIMGDLRSFVSNSIARRIQKIKDNISRIFSEENKKRILDKIKSLIDYAVSLFANPSLEEIQFLIQRICGFAGGLEFLLGTTTQPLDDFNARYRDVFNGLRDRSNQVTARAIAAGAPRLDDPTRQELINIQNGRWNDAAGVPYPIEDQEIMELPSFQQLLDGEVQEFEIEGVGWLNYPDKMLPIEGWINTDSRFRVLLFRLAREARNAGIVNGKIKLNSLYRNAEYNHFVRGVPNSVHKIGFAADLSWSGGRYGSSSNARALLEFAAVARRVGINGRGFYSGFIHVARSSENFTFRSDITQEMLGR